MMNGKRARLRLTLLQDAQDLVPPLSKIIQVLPKSQDIVPLPARCRIDPPSLHAAAEAADGGTLVRQVRRRLHDAWD